MQTVCASGMDRQMKGEYFKMKNHGLRRIFSLFLALFMVFTLLPTTALAEDTTGADETQPKTVVVNEGEKKTDPPAQEQPKDEDPPAPEDPKTFTVTYTDGVDGTVFPNQVYSNLSSGTATPAFNGTPERKGYTFVRWNPAFAGTVTADVTYVAQWEEKRVTVPTIPGPDPAPAALNTGHKIDVTFTVLYVGDEFRIGYNYGSSEKTKFVYQYSSNHSDTAYNNHTIAISDIKAAASRASVNSGYQIVGWSKESNANPTTWSLNKSGTTACNKGSTIYLVAKNPNPTTKYTYTLNYDANGGTGAPESQSYSEASTKSPLTHIFTVSGTEPTRVGYTFKGWSENKVGTDEYYAGNDYPLTARKDNPNVSATLYAVWEEATPPKPDKPTAPGEDSLSGLIGNITVNCTNEAAAHELKTKGYALISGSYTTGEVEGDAENGYTYTVTINSQKYVEQFDTDTGAAHTPKDAAATVTLKHTDNGWAVERVVPVVFNVACVTEIVPPAKPGAEDLAKLEAPVEVVCTTKPETHASARFSLIEGNYNIGDVSGNKTDGYTCDITVTADRYVAWYNLDYGKHTLTGDNTKKTLTLKYEEGKWVAEKPVTFPVKCETEPETTYTVTYTDGVVGVEVFEDVVHENLPYGTKTPAFYAKDPTRKGYVFTGWNPAVAAIVTGDATYTAVWEEDANGNGTPDKEEEKYTVSYTDGVENEEIFADQVYGNLLSGTATPAFNGTPTRAGYKFLGWEPTVAETVTENATYVAQWEKLYTVTYTDGVGGKAFEDDVHSDLEKDTKTPAYKDGIPTRKGFKFLGWEPEVAETVTENVTYTAKWEKLYTVTYTDGVKGKAFKDQVYSDLESGTDTPKFDGKPTRKGYTFTGWSPKVTDTVTKDVTYVAQWKSVKNGKDNIPKTGDSEIVMVLGSVLLFSFCGAAAVSVYDRKRKHF